MRILKAKFAALLLAFAMGSYANADQKTEVRPNIVLILCDDLGYADVGFNAKHFGVETDVVTPNLDRMASAGNDSGLVQVEDLIFARLTSILRGAPR